MHEEVICSPKLFRGVGKKRGHHGVRDDRKDGEALPDSYVGLGLVERMDKTGFLGIYIPTDLT